MIRPEILAALAAAAGAGWLLARLIPGRGGGSLLPPHGSSGARPEGGDVPGRRSASVLFADIRGFTHLSQRRSPEEVFRLLDLYTSEMTAALEAEGGEVHRILGDGLLAVFGGARDLPDHACASVRAALAMQGRAERLSAEWERSSGSPLRIVVAINSGEVIVGHLTGAPTDDRTVLGDAVNVAARLEAEAKELGVPILLTAETARLVEGTFPFRPVGRRHLRGRTGEVQLFALGTDRPPSASGDPYATRRATGEVAKG